METDSGWWSGASGSGRGMSREVIVTGYRVSFRAMKMFGN